MEVIIQANHFVNKIQTGCKYDNSSDCDEDYQQQDDEYGNDREYSNNAEDPDTDQPCSEVA